MIAPEASPGADTPAAIAAAFGASGPSVLIQYRPPCRVETATLFDPDLVDVVRALCRTLGLPPAQIEAVAPDWGPAEAVNLRDCWILGPAGDRIARVLGVGAIWLNLARNSLVNHGWRPSPPEGAHA